MLISNVHKSITVMNSLDKRFSRNVLEAVEKTRSKCFIGSKSFKSRSKTGARVLNITSSDDDNGNENVT